MLDFAKKISEYSEEMFADLGLAVLPEEKKADMYARVQEHIHQVILESLAGAVDGVKLRKIKEALEEENYIAVDKLLKHRQELKTSLEDKIDSEFKKFKALVLNEQSEGKI